MSGNKINVQNKEMVVLAFSHGTCKSLASTIFVSDQWITSQVLRRGDRSISQKYLSIEKKQKYLNLY